MGTVYLAHSLMGTVYLAHSLKVQRTVADKLWYQEHVVSVVRKQRQRSAGAELAFPFESVPDPLHGLVLPQLGWAFPLL